MAHNIQKTVLQNGSKSIIIHVYLESDGINGELDKVVLIDPAVDYPEGVDSKDVRLVVNQIWNSFSWFDALISFDDLNPVPSWLLVRDGPGYTDLRYFGGLKDLYVEPNSKESSDRTGKLLISTTDFAPIGSAGTLVIELKKAQG